MLRSVFSLIQNIIDSDREYNNKKSNTVIYLVDNRDSTLNMDLEIDGKAREKIKSVKEKPAESRSFQITTEQGDTITCKHKTDVKIAPKVSKDEENMSDEFKQVVGKIGESTSFTNEEQIPEEKIGEEGDNRMTVKDLLSSLPEKHAKMMEKDRDHIVALMDQIQKMKEGMERLQEIAQQFNCSEKFRQDVEYLVKNVASSLKDKEPQDKNLAPKKV
ncbi:unnamed protein product [Acanthoscelides obtectus]|uniref:Uncharacterized protein n=1 Tax=Acanthoscelides obtectus TaxID=200917 RepID=A0A9P0KZT3_ACAOB|nr:unnamed protein product [Acanthoscelides obtectus]CAK1645668.1 hypothetical protein AOBTE_LOCUS14198 [Acanthoscelides obtectus]